MKLQWRYRDDLTVKIGAGIIFLGLLIPLAYFGMSGLHKADLWVTHTHRVIETLESTLLNLTDAEINELDYLLTSDESYPTAYREAAAALKEQIAELNRLTVDNPHQQNRIAAMDALVSLRLKYLDEALKLQRAGAFSGEIRLRHRVQGKNIMDAIRKIIRDMESEELALLAQRREAARQHLYYLGFIFIALLIFIAAVLSRLFLDIRMQHRTQKELAASREALYQSQKLEAIGRLAGGVAHDFNNLLTGILGICDEMLEDSTLEERWRQPIREIVTAGNRAAALTKQLLGFGRRQIAAPVVLNVNDIVLNFRRMLGRLVGEDIELTTQLAPDLGSVKIDPGQVEQILFNLTLNARDAMPQGGSITIETANVHLGEEYVRQHFEVKPGDYILMAVSDTGTGIAPEVQSHIFEPFFSTKDRDKGTGLGLATVYGIVKQNNGDIFLYSTPGAGTTLKVYLPRINEAPISLEPPKKVPSEIYRGSETILIVEDESIVRMMAKRTLLKQGYRVLEAQNGKEALEICSTFTDPIHLMLTDVVMPGMSGRQLAELLNHSRPEMKVIYMSGYTENIIVNREILKPGIAFLEKSFTVEALTRKIRSVLDT